MTSTDFYSRLRILKTASEIIRESGFDLFNKAAVSSQLPESTLKFSDIVAFANLKNVKEIDPKTAEFVYKSVERVVDNYVVCTRVVGDVKERIMFAYLKVGDATEVAFLSLRMTRFFGQCDMDGVAKRRVMVTGPRKASSRTEAMKLFESNRKESFIFYHIPHEDMLINSNKHAFSFLEVKKLNTEEKKSVENEIENLTPLFSESSSIKQAGLIAGDVVQVVSIIPVEPTTIRGSMLFSESVGIMRVV